MSLLAFFKALTESSVDSIIRDFTTSIVKLETIAKQHTAKAFDHKDEAKFLLQCAKEFEVEADRALKIASNIKNIVKV